MRVSKVNISPSGNPLHLPVFTSRVRAGFPMPADDHIEKPMDLNEHLIKHPNQTFFVRAEGNSMVNAGIQDGALLLVDCSLTPKHDDIVIASIDGEMTCKFIDTKLNALRSANPHFEPIPIKEGNQVELMGVVIYVVNKLCNHL
jgi:DNA polymerase V